MSHSGWSTSNYISALGGTIPTAAPLTIHARYKPSSTAATASLVTLSNGTTNNLFGLRVTTSANVNALLSQGGSFGQAIGTTTLSTGTWYSLVAQFVSSTDRKSFVNGTQDGTNTTSLTPAGVNTNRVGILVTTLPVQGSLAEVAIWNVALSAEDIAALVTVSPLRIRPDALVCYIPLLDSGTLDLVAPAATVTGTLTKDSDHPSVIYPRRKALWVPKTAGGGAADLSASADQAFTFGQTATADVILQATASQPFSMGQTAEAVRGRVASADQGFVFGQTATVTGGTLEVARPGPADDRSARQRRRRDEEAVAYWAARQRAAREEEERRRLEALEEAQAALDQAEDAKKAKAKREAVRKVFEALNRAALTDRAKQEARDAEQAALQALSAKQSAEQRAAYQEALDRLYAELETIAAEVQRLYARRRQEEEFLLKMWAA